MTTMMMISLHRDVDVVGGCVCAVMLFVVVLVELELG